MKKIERECPVYSLGRERMSDCTKCIYYQGGLQCALTTIRLLVMGGEDCNAFKERKEK